MPSHRFQPFFDASISPCQLFDQNLFDFRRRLIKGIIRSPPSLEVALFSNRLYSSGLRRRIYRDPYLCYLVKLQDRLFFIINVSLASWRFYLYVELASSFCAINIFLHRYQKNFFILAASVDNILMKRQIRAVDPLWSNILSKVPIFKILNISITHECKTLLRCSFICNIEETLVHTSVLEV